MAATVVQTIIIYAIDRKLRHHAEGDPGHDPGCSVR
jgi:hypothetical protein